MAAWVGGDLIRGVEARGSSGNIGLRVIFLFLSETGKPVLQLTIGCFLAAIISWVLASRAVPISQAAVNIDE